MLKKNIIFWALLLLGFNTVCAQNLDIDLLQKLNIENPQDDKLWMGVTNSIKWVPTVYTGGNMIYGIAANDRDAKRYALESGISMGISMIITGGLKAIVQRPRPTATYPDLIHSYTDASFQSFPSGHTTLTAALATTASFQVNGKWYYSVPIFSYPIGVGYSRMRLGRHYPTDVLTGALIGIGSGILGHWITGQIVR